LDNDRLVYIVDDDASARGSVAALVQSMGVRATTFASAEEFLEAYDESKCSCLIVDLRMGGMSGLELLEAVSRRPSRPPAVLVSAFADVPTAVRAMSLGAVTVLQKPYQSEELWNSISVALAISQNRRRDEAYLRERQQRMASLTLDEIQVLDRILEGRPNKGIARELGVGLRTVEGRRHSIMAKLGARSLAELVHTAWETRAMARHLEAQQGTAPILSLPPASALQADEVAEG
jgi:two-component system, LuxR family, response regulator FixJ